MPTGCWGVMFTVCLAKKHVKASLACVELMQMMTQAMWPAVSPMLQIPYLTQKEIRLAGKKRLDTLDAFRTSEVEKKRKLYPDHTDAQWDKIDKVCANLPDMKLDCQAACEDEEGIFEGDIVTITVNLERLNSKESALDAVPEIKEEEETPAKKDTTVSKKKKDDDSDDEGDDSDEEDEYADPEADENERNLLETLPAAPKISKFGKVEHGSLVHSAFYPWPKHEKWVIMLFEKTKNKTLKFVSIQKVNPFVDKETVMIRVRVGEKGVWPYELHAKCDSYVGCDVSLSFKITVQKMTKSESDKRTEDFEHGKLAGLDADEEEEEEEYEGKWYYAGFASVWELLLNLVVLALLGLFVVNFLQTRGYWAKYVDPIVDKVYGIVNPHWQKVWPFIKPVWEPIYAVLCVIWKIFVKIAGVGPEGVADPGDELLKDVLKDEL